ncbi:MAG: trypsin-like peptidase domain-containing protein [bacterium]|nr:trypsin-like peptidase domain-containing protein [bacterium]
MRRNLILASILVILLAFGISSGRFGFSWSNFGRTLPRVETPTQLSPGQEKIRVVSEESVVIDVVKNVGPSAVTIGIEKQQKVVNPFEIDPFDPFSVFRQPQVEERKIEQNIGSGFIISDDGLIVTNKHVVFDTEAKYKVVTADDKVYEVKKVYRDPSNDLAILKIDPPAEGFAPVELGDSSKLEVGQFVIAIGNALGEFRNTVTTGVVSGLGRGITAGSPFEGSAERLDNVIQTDAAINPGNSGGPLLNSAGQVIGVNVAVAQGGQNIGFALPINLVKESLINFEQTGRFSRPYLGIQYKMVGRDLALLNDVPEGAYVVDVISGSPAESAGVKSGSIITKIDGKSLRESEGGLAKVVAGKKVGDRVSVTVWSDGKERTVDLTLGESTGE